MNKDTIDRRAFVRLGGMAAAAAALRLPGQAPQPSLAPAATAPAAWPATSAAWPADPDQLFQAGWFAAADRGYARELRQDPGNEHALAQRGYIALLSNRFADAEGFLTQAIRLAPDDTFSAGKLADCYLRQDQFTRAVPLLRQAGDAVEADLYAALAGVPYQVLGPESTRVPIVAIDPLPVIEASLNGGPPQPFIFDTGATTPGFTTQVAEELNLTAVASATGTAGGHSATIYFGWLESFRIGEIEVRNLPVQWSDLPRPAPPGGPVPVGALGTVFFFHFLTTLDYQGMGFILRRKSNAVLREFQAAARRAGYRPLPLWLADSREAWAHIPCTLGRLNDFGPRVVSMDTGGARIGIVTTA